MLKSDIRILLADDHPMMLDGLMSGLQRVGYSQIDLASNGQEVIDKVESQSFDLLILDIEMPQRNGFEIVEYLHDKSINIPVIFLSYHKEKKYLAVARKLGAMGYMLKEDGIQVLNTCIQHVIQGTEFYSPSLDDDVHAELSYKISSLNDLTRSERTILQWIAKGLTSAEVAEELNISKKTVQNHRSKINQKLFGELNNTDLGQWAVANRELIDRL